MDNWIRVEESLPGYFRAVLMAREGREEAEYGFLSGKGWWIPSENFESGFECITCPDVTHWQYPPDVPT